MTDLKWISFSEMRQGSFYGGMKSAVSERRTGQRGELSAKKYIQILGGDHPWSVGSCVTTGQSINNGRKEPSAVHDLERSLLCLLTCHGSVADCGEEGVLRGNQGLKH